jgi:large subunit ribosomal protein L21
MLSSKLGNATTGQDCYEMTDTEKVTETGAKPYAVIETGGKQYRVGVGDRIAVERLHEDEGSDINFERVLLVGGDGSTRIGTPVVDGANVTAHIDAHGRGEKIVIFKFKAKKRYRRRTGHRQELTRLTITGISG